MSRILNVLFWSIIAAAFIGPGTVTTAASSGAKYGYSLLWALLFSTAATLVLQEASARLTIVSGLTLAEAIRRRFSGTANGLLVLIVVVGAIIFGCAAYEAGNILGGVSGLMLTTEVSFTVWTMLIGLFAGLLLWFGTPRAVAYTLSAAVAFMGVAFLFMACLLRPPLESIARNLLLPTFPRSSGLLILGLIGTTVVPYNLFLGSGLARDERLPEMRFGLCVSIVLGGLISMAVLVVGTAITGEFSFSNLSRLLTARLGSWAGTVFSFGLAAAGISSAITAPLAAAITARGLFERRGETRWGDKSWRYRSIWLSILLVGVGFGLADVRPIPAIILAQALNGIVLPLMATFLFHVVNDAGLMAGRRNHTFSNILMGAVVIVTIVLGTSNVFKAAATTLGMPAPNEGLILGMALLVALAVAIRVGKSLRMSSGDS